MSEKSKLLLTFLLLMPLFLSAQEVKIKFFDNNLKEVKKHKATVYSVEYYNDEGYFVSDIYNNITEKLIESTSYVSHSKRIKDGYSKYIGFDGIIDFEGFYRNQIKHGEWRFYEDGKLATIENYSNGERHGLYRVLNISTGDTIIYGEYADAKETGKWTKYHNNGKLKSECIYIDGNRDGFYYTLFKNGDTSKVGQYNNGDKIGTWNSYFVDGDLQWQEHYLENGNKTGEWTQFYDSDTAYSIGKYIDDSLDGEWIYYHDNGQPSSIEHYDNGELLDFQFYDKQGKKENYSDVPYKSPSFPGGSKQLMQFLAKNISYPAYAQENNIEGRVVLKFIVSSTGKIYGIDILRDPGGGTAEEAVRVVQSMPKWEPGVFHNLDVNIYFTLPIKFKLD